MKLLVLFSIIALVPFCLGEELAQPTETTTFVQLSKKEIANDPTVQILLDYGVNYITQRAVNAKKVAPDQPDFKVYKIDRIEKEAETGNYRFSLKVGSEDKTIEVPCTFVAFYLPSDDYKEIVSSSYILRNNFVEISLEEALQSTFLIDIMDFGAKASIATGVEKGKFEDSDYKVEKVYRVSKQNQYPVENYRFKVDMKDSKGSLIVADYTVKYTPSSGRKFLMVTSAKPATQE